MIQLRRTQERHHDQRGKREVWRTFDPSAALDRVADGFGALEAVDESRLPPRADIPRRVRGTAETITYVREGEIAYEDSAGQVGVIQAGEFQRMITANEARHCEANASRAAWAHVFQIRMRCAETEPEPGREQKRFSAAERRAGLCVVASPDGRGGSLRLVQDTVMFSALLGPGQHIVHELAPGRAAWLHVVHGEVAIAELVLVAGDGIGVTAERSVSLTARGDAEILLLEVPADRVGQAGGP
ncbi:MAG TPA: pirin family protein [Kofleriaceae bacterium]|nr:pirin family protein [Kofleriaceae bacterium]